MLIMSGEDARWQMVLSRMARECLYTLPISPKTTPRKNSLAVSLSRTMKLLRSHSLVETRVVIFEKVTTKLCHGTFGNDETVTLTTSRNANKKKRKKRNSPGGVIEVEE